jgi:hypothetical protein
MQETRKQFSIEKVKTYNIKVIQLALFKSTIQFSQFTLYLVTSCDSPEQVSHYHAFGPQFETSSVTWQLASLVSRYRF